jgi:GTP-binding protein HflX
MSSTSRRFVLRHMTRYGTQQSRYYNKIELGEMAMGRIQDESWTIGGSIAELSENAVPRCILVGVPLRETSDDENLSSLNELQRLVTTLGFEAAGRLSQRRSKLRGVVLGEGKLAELAELCKGTDADSVVHCAIFDCELSPSQLANLEQHLGTRVLDRTGVIVEIFSRHARTREARLQVEIARLRYLAPRLREHIRGRGEDRINLSGETSLEMDRRRIRDRVAELRVELETVQREQHGRRQGRSESRCVALVGYTNAGKSSLMRALTGSEVMVADKLFATLDTTVRALFPPTQPRILVTDTVGFIRKLPHDLVASFRSTLEEARAASLLLFVVDASDVECRKQLEVTRQVLAEIDLADVPFRIVLNKVDLLADEAGRARLNELLAVLPDAVLLSTRDSASVAALRDAIVLELERGMIEAEVKVPYSVRGVIGEIRDSLRVVSEEYDDDGVVLVVRGESAAIDRVKRML